MENIWKLDLMIISVTLLALVVLVGYAQPLVIAPLNEYKTSSGEILFEFERADSLLIDDNEEFTSPDEYDVAGGLVVVLEPGVYYWKAVGVLKSEVRKLTVQSRVELRLVETEEGFSVVNAGNVRLNVDVYNDSNLIEKRKVGVGESVDGGDKYIGEYNG